MSADDSNPFADTPPEWVPLCEAPALLEQRFGLPARLSADRLRGKLQDNRIEHRINGLTRDNLRVNDDALRHLDCGWPISIEPPGFEYLNGMVRVGSDDWEEVNIDWLTGTVAGLRQPDGTRARHSVELSWREVEKLAAMWRREMVHVPVANQTPDGRASASGSKTSGARDKPTEASTWMRAYVRGWNHAGSRPKREDTIKLCQRETAVTYREARKAWDVLPAGWKNRPRTAAS